MYSTGQAAVQHVVLRPLRGGGRDPPPGIARQFPAPALREPDEHREEERDPFAGGDVNHALQPRRHIVQQGNQVNCRGNCTSQNDNRSEIRQRRHNRPRPEQQRVHVETLRNTDSPFSGDETDTQQEAAAEGMAQHVEEESLTLNNQPEEKNETSASNPVAKHTQPASKEPSAKSEAKDKLSGDTKRNEVKYYLVVFQVSSFSLLIVSVINALQR